MRRRYLLYQIIGLTFLLTASAQADIRLSVRSVDGGTTLRFGRVGSLSSIDQEVQVRIDSSDGNQYQVYQRMLEPLTNERGETLQDSVLLSGAAYGSNAQGSLYLTDLEPLRSIGQHIYTSDPNGTSDGFTVFYRADSSRINASGSFLGKILYSVQPINGGAVAEQILTVTLDAEGGLNVETEASDGTNRVRISSDQRPTDGADYRLSFSNNISRQLITLYQELDTLPRNDVMQSLNPDLLKVMITQSERGDSPQTFSLAPGQERIYAGDAEADVIDCRFMLDPEQLSQQPAGRYQGVIHYVLESGSQRQVFDLDLEVEIQPIFEMTVMYPPEGMAFKGLLASDPPEERVIQVQVKSTLGSPYIVTQLINSPMTSEDGRPFQTEYFRLKGDLMKGGGRVGYQEYSPVPLGEAVLYESDPLGSSAIFSVTYQLKPYQGMEAGNYKMGVVYSLGEM